MSWKDRLTALGGHITTFGKKKAQATLIGALVMTLIGIMIGVALVGGAIYLYRHWHTPTFTMSTPAWMKGTLPAPPSGLVSTILGFAALVLIVVITVAITRYLLSPRNGAAAAPVTPTIATPGTPAPPNPAPAPAARAQPRTTSVMSWLKVVAGVVGIIVLVALAFSFVRWLLTSPTPTTTAEAHNLPAIPVEGVLPLTIKEGAPAKISVPPGYRWEILPPIPASGWTTDGGSRDQWNNRIQVFEVVPPATEVSLQVKIGRCATPQACAW